MRGEGAPSPALPVGSLGMMAGPEPHEATSGAPLSPAERPVDARIREVDGARQETQRLREDLESVLESASWRLTRPLRRLRRSTRPEDIDRAAGDVADSAFGAVTPPVHALDPVCRRIDPPGARFGEQLPRISPPDGLATVYTRKVDLIAECSGARALRDFGGLYLVHGRYLLEPAVRLRADYACMVDVTPRSAFETAIADAKAQHSALEVEFVTGDFRDPTLYDALQPVDVSILYEVLLHQENYVDVIHNVLRTTRSWVCVGQPCLREDVFALPAAAVLVQFLDDATKAELRRESVWPPSEPMTDRFRTDLWMWGHSTSHLISLFHGFGWELEHGEIYEGVCGPYWEFPLLRFRNADSAHG
jgi:hypothetical protein